MSPFLRSLAFSLAFGAMLLRAALPAGWMPNPVEAGNGPLAICTSHGLAHNSPLRSPGHAPLPDRGEQVCPFAAVAHLAPPIFDVLSVAPASSDGRLSIPFPPSPVAAAPVRAAHGSRAPPVLA